jgi:hypothetical protein
MGIKFKAGDPVRQVVPVIEGTVVGPVIQDGDVAFEVAYTDADGNQQVRTFTEDQIELKV